MSWWGENTSYGRVSQSGNWLTGKSGGAKNRSSSQSLAASAAPLQTTMTGLRCLQAAALIASAGAAPYRRPQRITPPGDSGNGGVKISL
ncbi:hypothetical protein MnTg04_00265 [bacterium MnTg04]|nr:hypothetical protein MnTg04_00265 [bacterium MnTg04]